MILLALILAAFLTGRYLKGSASIWPGSIDPENVTRITSAELPTSVPDVFGSVGIVLDRGIRVMEYPVISGEVHALKGAESGSTGIEAVFTRETIIYEDVTDRSTPVVQDGVGMQVVNRSELNQIGPNAFVMIWGKRQGERIIADIICFQNR